MDIKKIKEIILNAGKIVKEGFSATKEIKHKGSIDLVTEYDIKVEKFLIEKFKEILPNYEIVAEESENKKRDNPNKIIIDPIDGTTNFVHQIPFVAISVGIYENNLPLIGIVYNPILNEFFYAKRGEGAYLNNQKLNVTKTDNLKESLITTGFPYTIDKSEFDHKWNVDTISKVLKEVQGIRRLGSAALDLCYVARGSFDGYYEMNLKPWDVSAGILILSEAGGKISNEKGESYNIFDDKFCVATNGYIHNKLLEVIN